MGIHFPVTSDTKGFMQGMHEIVAGVKDATRQIEANGGDIDRVISMIKKGLATIGIGWGFKELVGQITNTRDEFQKLEIAFKTFLGSEEEANKLMKQMVHTAAITPFDLAGVADGAKNLLAFGVAAEDVNKTIISLGDIAAGLSQPLGDIIYLYGTTIAKPKMDTQDLMQMMGRGIPIAKELAKQFGVAENKVRDLISAGKVSGEAVKKAFESMTAEGSMFGGLMEAQSKSIGGKIANIEDSVAEMFNEIGKSTEGIINVTLDATGKIVENWQTVLLILTDVAAAYGAQKAMLVLDAGFTKAATNYGYDAEIEQLKALIPVKEEEARTALRQAVASGNLTEAKAAEIMALREEAEAYLEVLATKEAEARQNELIAQANLTTALQEKDIADDFVKSCEEKIDALFDLGDTIGLQAAEEELATAQTIQSEAANALATATSEARAAASAHVAAQQEVESATTALNTAQTAGNTAATGILTIAKEKLALAIQKVNAALKANQFAIVTGAVIALGYAIYKLATYESDYEKSINSAKEAALAQEASMRKEISTLDELKKKLESSKKGTEEWKCAKDAIVSQYGKYFNGLDEEITKTGTLASSYNELTKAIRLSAAARAMDDYRKKNEDSLNDDLDEVLDESQKRLQGTFLERDRYGNLVKDKKGKTKKIKLSEEDQQRLQQAVYNYATTGNLNVDDMDKAYLKAAGLLTTHYGEGKADKHLQKVKNIRAGEELIAKKYGTTVDDVDGVDKNDKSEPKGTNFDTAYNNAKQAYSKAKADVAKMNANRKAYTREAYENAVSELKSAKEEFEKLGGEPKEKKSSGKTADQIGSDQQNAHQKLLYLMKSQGEERIKLRQDYEYQEWQNRIDLMQEGEAKVLAQMQLDNKKELSALEEQKQSAINAEIARQKALSDAREDEKAAGNKKYAKEVFDPKSIYDPEKNVASAEIKEIIAQYGNLQAQLIQKQEKAESDRLETAKESMNAYLKEFGDYQQKREAIEEEYAKKIAEAQNEGERMMYIGQRDKAISDLDYDKWINTGEIALAFGDISNISDRTIKKLISDMEKYRDKVIATFDPDKIQKYEDALANLRKVDIDNSFGAFASYVPDWFKQRKSVGSQMDSAGENVNRLYEERAAIYNRILSLKEQISEAESNGENTDELKNKLGKEEHALSTNADAAKKAQDSFKLLKEQWDNLDTPQDKFEALCGVIGSISNLVGQLASQASEMADALGAEGLGEALGYLGDAMGSVSNIASGFANGGIVGGIAAAAGEIMGWIGKIANAGDNRKQKNIERLQEQIDALNKSYEKLGKLADDAFSTDASQLIEQQDTLLRQQQALIRQQIAEEEAKKKTDDEKIKQWKEQLEEINDTLEDNKNKVKEAIIGEDLKSAINEFASLYAEAWNDGADAAQKSMAAVKSIISSALSELLKKNIQPAATRFYDALSEAMKDGILTDAELDNLDAIKRQIDALAASSEEQYKMIQSRYKDLDELKEELTDISFDSVKDNFKSLLSDMESTTADFTNSFSDMLRNALIEGLMSEKYDLMLKEWYDEFAEKMNDRKLTDEERDALRQQYDAIVKQGLEDRDFINSIVGGGAYSQSATQGGWASMGQDTADELNGRFTALTELNAINNTLTAEGNLLSAQILDTLRNMTGLRMVTDGDNSTIRDIRDMMFLSTGHLEDISKYTRQLITIREGIDNLNDLINKRL